MLDSSGGCTESLPTSYVKAGWRRIKECGHLDLDSAGTMTNPEDPLEVIQVSKPNYSNLNSEKNAKEGLFTFFTMIVMFIFFASLVGELLDIFRVTDFIVSFPATRGAEDRGGDAFANEDDDGLNYEFTRIDGTHRMIVVVVTVLRVMILLYLLDFGIWFLLMQTRYIDLVLNSLALTFIIEVDETMFTTFIDR